MKALAVSRQPSGLAEVFSATSIVFVPSAEADSVGIRAFPALTCGASYVPPLRGWGVSIPA